MSIPTTLGLWMCTDLEPLVRRSMKSTAGGHESTQATKIASQAGWSWLRIPPVIQLRKGFENPRSKEKFIVWGSMW